MRLPLGHDAARYKPTLTYLLKSICAWDRAECGLFGQRANDVVDAPFDSSVRVLRYMYLSTSGMTRWKRRCLSQQPGDQAGRPSPVLLVHGPTRPARRQYGIHSLCADRPTDRLDDEIDCIKKRRRLVDCLYRTTTTSGSDPPPSSHRAAVLLATSHVSTDQQPVCICVGAQLSALFQAYVIHGDKMKQEI